MQRVNNHLTTPLKAKQNHRMQTHKKPTHHQVKLPHIRHTKKQRIVTAPNFPFARLLLAMLDTAPLLTFLAPDDGARTHERNVRPHVLRVEAGLAEPGLDNVGWYGPERGQNVEGAGVVAVECADEDGGFAVLLSLVSKTLKDG